MALQNILSRPLPRKDYPFQNGISDPLYPLLPPDELKNKEDYSLYKGLVDKQDYLTILRADVMSHDCDELKSLFQILTRYVRESMEKKPSVKHLLPLEHGKIPESYRVTVTLGIGSTLFIDSSGNDRFDIRHRKPKYLKVMPSFPGDLFRPENSTSDLIILIASDHPYINVAIARYFAEYVNKDFCRENKLTTAKTIFKVTDINQGFGRPDKREFLRFDDGIDNLRSGIDLERLVYVDDVSNEPPWCINGTYLVYRKIREMMPVWEAFSTKQQEGIVGREKESGKPLSHAATGVNNLTPVYPNHKDAADGPLNAHIRKVQPRRLDPDLFGVNDLDRRFLRRPYPFFDGVNAEGTVVNGLHFVAYMKSIQQQFEHVANMWQMNEDFPVPGTGIDALYRNNVLKTLSGGYYFCPPAPKNDEDFLCSGLFLQTEKKIYDVPAHIYGYGITFVDIDETIFNTFASINVLKNGEVIKKLDNQQFNEYNLEPGESFDFGEFKDSATFLATSKPITSIIRIIKKMLTLVTANSEGSRIVFLTARSDFDNKETFLNTFRKYGIDIDSARMFVERSGNIEGGTVAERKKTVVLKYLSEGIFRRARLIDDNRQNLAEFLTIESDLSADLTELIRKNHSLGIADNPIEFSAYVVNELGEIALFKKE